MIALALVSWLTVSAASGPAADQYIVLFDGSVRSAEAGPRAEALATRHGGQLRAVYRHAVRGFALRLPAPAAAAALAREHGVLLVEPDAEVRAAATQAGAPWHLDRIDQRALPLDGAYTYGRSGSGVHAYVVDSGIRASHVEFGGRVLAGYDGVGDGLGTADCHGHGTHVAATLGGASSGVARDVTLGAVRVLGCAGTGTVSAVIAGIDWVTAQGVLPAVGVLSLETPASAALDAAVEGALAAGVVWAVAAGNGATDACAISPARVPGAITVGASTAGDRVEFSSNQGSCVDLFAPGQDVVSAWHTADTATFVLSGTSTAAPQAAGVAAQYLEANPSASPSAVSAALASNATSGQLLGLDGSAADRLLFSAFLVAAPVDDTPPLSQLLAPVDGVWVRGDVTAEVSVWDDVAVTRVELRANGGIAAWADGPARLLPWNSAAGPDGAVVLSARAFDAAGNFGDSAIVTVHVDNTAPACTITSPKSGASFVRGPVTVRVDATDANGIGAVELRVGGVLVATDTTAPYQLGWDASRAAKGRYTLEVRAFDVAGNGTVRTVDVRLR